MEFHKPLVTIELDEYNSMLKYIETIEAVSSSNFNPYKVAIKQLLERMLLKEFNQYDYSNSTTNLVINILNANGIRFEIDRINNIITFKDIDLNIALD